MDNNTIKYIVDTKVMPGSLQEAENILKELIQQTKIAVPVSCMLLSDARRWFNGDVRGWVTWAKDITGMEGSEIHHRRAIGDMLIGLKESVLYKILINTDSVKLLTLTRIPIDQIEAFWSSVKVQQMSRDDLRIAVCHWLGEDTSSESKINLPVFNAWLGYSDASISDIADKINDRSTAKRSTKAACNIISAAVVRYIEDGSVLPITELKEQLVGLLKDIDDSIGTLIPQ